MNDFKQVSVEGDFSLWVNHPVYKTYTISRKGYIRNTKTGENCGQKLCLRKHYYNGATRLQEPIYDEDCYECVFLGREK